MPGTRRVLQKWMEGMACTRDLRFLHAIRVCRRALGADANQAKRLERQAWTCIQEALKRQSKRPRQGRKLCDLGVTSSTSSNTYGPLKINFIFDPPAGAPFGFRPRTFFVRLSSRLHEGLRLFAEAEGLDLEAAILLTIRRGLEDFRSHIQPSTVPGGLGMDLPI